MNDVVEQPEVAAALERLEKQEFPMPVMIKEHRGAQMPATLDTLGSPELGNYLGMWAALFGRAKFEQAKYESNELVLEKQIGWMKKKALAMMDAKAKVTVEKAKIDVTPEVLQLEEQLSVTRAHLKLLSALAIGYAKNFDAVSREISRREKEREQWNRKHTDGDGFVIEEDDDGREKSWSTR
jgi:hypothetical protein